CAWCAGCVGCAPGSPAPLLLEHCMDLTHNGSNEAAGRPTTALVPVPRGAQAPAARPQPVTAARPFYYNADEPAATLYPGLGQRLAEGGGVYRLAEPDSGLLVVPARATIRPRKITSGKQLAHLVTDRVPLVVVQDGKPKGSRIPAAD